MIMKVNGIAFWAYPVYLWHKCKTCDKIGGSKPPPYDSILIHDRPWADLFYVQNSLTVQDATRNPTKSAISAAGMVYLVFLMPAAPK